MNRQRMRLARLLAALTLSLSVIANGPSLAAAETTQPARTARTVAGLTRTGVDVLQAENFRRLAGQRVGLLTN
ncbi:MAG: hypothetical protein ACKOCF_06900, partial [Gammaproteobacteria bacterium]